MGDYTLLDQLTNLLMENGASVSKTSIEALVKFIAERDQSIIEQVIKDSERTLRQLQADTRVSDLVATNTQSHVAPLKSAQTSPPSGDNK